MHSHPSWAVKKSLSGAERIWATQKRKEQGPLGKLREKQGFKLYIDSRKQTPLPLSPLKVCVCLSVVELKTHPMPPGTTCTEPVYL